MRIVLLAAVSGLAFTSQAFAETSSVDELIVTATRLPSAAEDIPGVRVITSEQIETRQAVFAIDVLETVPGLSVFRNGMGGAASIRIRGAESDKTLVLIDGVPLNDPSAPDGGYDLSSLDLADIERVEILAGPQGSIWGSDAIGGVVAFTTRELDGYRALAEAGSFGTARLSGAFGMADADQALGLAVTAYRTDGVSAAADGTEDDGSETRTVTLNGRKRLGPVSLDGRLRYVEAEAEQDGVACVLNCATPDWMDDVYALTDTNGRYESQAWSGFVRARADAFGLRHTASFSAYDIERVSHSAFSSPSFDADRQVWRWQAEGGAPKDAFAFVVGAEREDTEAKVGTGTDDLGASSVFGVVRWTASERLTATGSLRYDDPDKYESETTARVSAAFKAGAGFTLSAAWGQGFKTPTISHTLCDYCDPAGPSVGLTPEFAEGWDVRAAWKSPEGRFSADVTGYRLSVRDQIAYYFNPSDFSSRYVNLERTLTKGIEAQAEVGVNEAVSLRFAYAYTDAIDAVTGLELVRAPLHSGSISAEWKTDFVRGDVTIRAESEQADIDSGAFSRTERDGFVVVDVANAWTIAEGLEFTARVENLTDQDFQEVFGYAEAGRAAYVGLRLRR